MIEVVMVPVVVSVIGVVWMQAGAWTEADAGPSGGAEAAGIAGPLVAVLALLVFFQCVLRPGIRFG